MKHMCRMYQSILNLYLADTFEFGNKHARQVLGRQTAQISVVEIANQVKRAALLVETVSCTVGSGVFCHLQVLAVGGHHQFQLAQHGQTAQQRGSHCC